MCENKCIVCGKVLQKPKKMYCSNACKQKAHYNKTKQNPNTVFNQTLRGYRRKIKLIELKGGKCESCGYDKNIAALDFHHIDPQSKSFPLDIRKLSNTKWESLLEEATKCKLLCSNCHREIHNPEMTKENISQMKSLEEYKALNDTEVVHYKNCPICNKEIPKTNGHTYCSEECKQKALEQKFIDYPSKEDVNNKYKELKSWEKVAQFYNLTRRIISGIRNRK